MTEAAEALIETGRLRLRRWLPRDRVPFAAMNADPEVMRHFPQRLSAAESDAVLTRLEDRWREDGLGLAAVERREDGVFLGMAGLMRVRFAPLKGTVEIGWRLARAHWRQGYATEAARAWLAYGFGELGLAEVVAFTVPENLASKQLMRGLGMTHDPARDFDHPALPEGHLLRGHLLYVIGRDDGRGVAP